MRLGVLSDVHANLAALEAVVARLEREGVDGWLCPGDLVGYGPDPDACVERVLDGLGATTVAGNHDLITLGRLSDARCVPLAQRTLAWTRNAVSERTRERLAALPLEARTGAVLMTHGALGDPALYVYGGEAGQAQLAALPEGAELLLLGHTHRALALREDGETLLADRDGVVRLEAGRRHLLNPGAVGQSRERTPLARAMVLDLERREATFLAVEYDVEQTRARLREQGLPPDAFHVTPRPLWRRAASRVVRPVRRRLRGAR
jgi:predicted phosphodiesterase